MQLVSNVPSALKYDWKPKRYLTTMFLKIFSPIRTSVGNIIRKKKFLRLHSQICFCCQYRGLNIFFAESAKLSGQTPWNILEILLTSISFKSMMRSQLSSLTSRNSPCYRAISRRLINLRKASKWYFRFYWFNPNMAGLFEGGFFWGGSIWPPFPPPSYFKKNLTNINITLYNC